jgi:hypothetical protein
MMKRFVISLGVAVLTAAAGAAYVSAGASAVSAATTCTPNVNGQWTAEFNTNGTANGGPGSDANTYGNGGAQLTIFQVGSHPGFEWQVTAFGMAFAYGNGTVSPDMTFMISGKGMPGSPLMTVKASGDLVGGCTPSMTSNTAYTATYKDGSSVSNGMAELFSNSGG